MLASILGSIHNVSFFQSLMGELREAIGQGRYTEFRDAWK